ncbi:MAG: S-adenosylmethionine-binding protein, partial [Chloroflexi bacterium]|nr:S-adenosylmethionine-binding protein [Chloroflexota bacterium]
MEYKHHPASSLFPMMAEDELLELSGDIKKNGLVEPIVLSGELVLDGRNRLAACQIVGVSPRFMQWGGSESPVTYVLSKNLHRRHLTTSQRAAIAAEFVPMRQEEAHR